MSAMDKIVVSIKKLPAVWTGLMHYYVVWMQIWWAWKWRDWAWNL